MRKKQAKKPPGRPPVHGGYSVMVRAGELPVRRSVLRAYLSGVREGLIRDVAGSEEELTTGQRILVDRAVSLLSILRCVEEHVRETGVFKGPELAPVLARSYTSYSAELRRVLEVLGIHGRAQDRVLAPYEIVDKERAAWAKAGRSSAGSSDGQGSEGPGDGDSGPEAGKRASGSRSAGRSSEGEGQGQGDSDE